MVVLPGEWRNSFGLLMTDLEGERMKTRNVEAYAELHRKRQYGATAVRMRRYVEPWVQIDAPA